MYVHNQVFIFKNGLSTHHCHACHNLSKAVRVSQRVIFLLEKPGSDYKPSDTSAVQKIIIDGGKDKADEGKDVGLSNDKGKLWGGLSFVITELTLVMSRKK